MDSKANLQRIADQATANLKQLIGESKLDPEEWDIVNRTTLRLSEQVLLAPGAPVEEQLELKRRADLDAATLQAIGMEKAISLETQVREHVKHMLMDALSVALNAAATAAIAA